MAAAACWTWISKLEPPVWVESVQRGVMPRRSASSSEGAQPRPLLMLTPSTSARVSPASSRASRIMRASSWGTVPSSIPEGAGGVGHADHGGGTTEGVGGHGLRS